jgi:cell division septum initiation protein DivIVA
MSEMPSFRSALNGFNRKDVVNYLKTLLDENADLLSKLAETQNEVAQKNAELELVNAQLSEAKAERQNEQMLGRAIYDARRFSDILLKEANEQADAMLKNAADTASDFSRSVDALSEETVDFSSLFADAMGDIQDKLVSLNESLEAFRSQVDSRKDVLLEESGVLDVLQNVTLAKAETTEDEEEAPAGEAPAEDDPADGDKHPVRLTVRKVKR